VREDYDFTNARAIPEDRANHRTLAWHWELERELGSGKGPFLRSAYAKKWLLHGKGRDTRDTRVLREIPLSEIEDRWRVNPPHSLRAFNFDLTATERVIVKQFKRWLKTGPLLDEYYLGGIRREFDPLAALRKLGVYRLRSAGCSSREVAELLGNKQKLPPNVARDVREAREAILERLRAMQEEAKAHGADWRERFTHRLLAR
jgi:DNA-binding transcriptional MerR regulator